MDTYIVCRITRIYELGNRSEGTVIFTTQNLDQAIVCFMKHSFNLCIHLKVMSTYFGFLKV